MTYNLVEIQKRQESTDKFVQKVGKMNCTLCQGHF